MHEGNELSMRPVDRRLAEQSHPGLLHTRTPGLNIVAAQRDMMNPLAVLLQKLRDRAFIMQRFQQLDLRLPEPEKRHPHALALHLFGAFVGEPEHVAVEHGTGLYGTYCDANMIDLVQHTCSLKDSFEVDSRSNPRSSQG